jgi:hypothetical protein
VPYRADMSGDRAPGRSSTEPASNHLDEDPEALEDPVHRGDATHQHDVHERHAHEQEHQGEDTATGAATPDDGD